MSLATGAKLSDRRRECVSIDVYPALGRFLPLERSWQVLVQGRVVRARRDSLRRRVLLRLLGRVLRITPDEVRSPELQDRLRGFLMSGVRGQCVTVHIGDRSFALRPTRPDGKFQSAIRVSGEMINTWFGQSPPTVRQIPFATSVRGAQEEFPGLAVLIPPRGFSVISDIDDTLKVTNVSDRRDLLANTFLNPFEPIPAMAALYQEWARQGCAFHYVSASPWQLFRPLDQFLEQAGYPPGSLDLRTMRLRGPSLIQLLVAGRRSKRRAMVSILRMYPFRRFILVGDAGERDPELYGAIARKFPRQIDRILIRRLSSPGIDAERLDRAFGRLSGTRWRVFEQPDELKGSLPFFAANSAR
jgi:phosphatidate phosphatase APP1